MTAPVPDATTDTPAAGRGSVAHALSEEIKPKLRGWIHEGAFPISVLAGAILVIAANSGRERLAFAIYAKHS